MIERGHRTWIKSLLKTCGRKPSKWSRYFHAALWADRVSVKRTTGYSPYQLLYGTPHTFPFDIRERTWYTLEWDKIHDEESLLAIRTKQLAQLQRDRKTASESMLRARMHAANAFAEKYKSYIVKRLYKPGQLVLVSHKRLTTEGARRNKADDLWSGPYRIHKNFIKGYYILKELSGEVIKGTISGKHLKAFRTRFINQRHPKNINNHSSGSESENEQAGDPSYEIPVDTD